MATEAEIRFTEWLLLVAALAALELLQTSER